MTDDGRGLIAVIVTLLGCCAAFVCCIVTATCIERTSRRSDYRDCVTHSAAHPQAVSACAEILK